MLKCSEKFSFHLDIFQDYKLRIISEKKYQSRIYYRQEFPHLLLRQYFVPN
jgi:hypothetical protein